MKIVKRGPKSPKAKTYEFTCNSCRSLLKAKSFELREFGFKNDVYEKNKRYVFTCPVCNCQRVVRKSELRRVRTVGEVVDALITKAAKKEEKEAHGLV